MRDNYRFTNVNQALPVLAREVLQHGEEIGSRAGRTKELCHIGVTLENPVRRETVLSARRGSVVAQLAETMWVLSGRNDVEWLGHYLPRAKDFSDDGSTWRGAYGSRLRAWPRRDGSGDVIDQFAWLIDHLKADPASRRAVMTLFDPVVDQTAGKDIPCNNWLDFKSRLGKLDLHVALRSNDLIWGWSGINAFEWSVLLEVAAGLLGLQVGSLHFSISSLHVYDRHWERARKIGESQYRGNMAGAASPAFEMPFGVRTLEAFDSLTTEWFRLEEQIRGGNMRPAGVTAFPEPMMQSWLRVLQWWWSRDEKWLEPLKGTQLYMSALNGVQPPKEEEVARPPADQGATPPNDFSGYVAWLHGTKNAAYGDSWKKRGEKVGIQANIARKVDRLGKTDDLETAADTAIDLLVYLLKYRWWLFDEARAGGPFAASQEERLDETTRVTMFLKHLDRNSGWSRDHDYVQDLQSRFEELLRCDPRAVVAYLNPMIDVANAYARKEFWQANNAKRSWKGYGE